MHGSFKNLLLLFLIALLLFRLNAQPVKALPDLSMPPSSIELFGEGIVSTNLYERDMAISPDGMEIFFTLQSNQGKFSSVVYICKKMVKADGPGRPSHPSPACSAIWNRRLLLTVSTCFLRLTGH
ncbi:MAG TPA: hypothetical protein VK543_01340 [Puia sp.]|nr:hypothetical protein [Puia sp.]